MRARRVGYVGCPVTGMDEGFIQGIYAFQAKLEEYCGVGILRWVKVAGNPNWGPVQAYGLDKGYVREADFLVFVHHASSTGLGFEMGLGVALGKPILHLVPEGLVGKTSSIVLGMPPNEDAVELQLYSGLLSEGPGLVSNFLDRQFPPEVLPLFDEGRWREAVVA